MSPGRVLFMAFFEARIFLRTRETLLWTFVMPIVFFFFIGTVTGGFGSPTGGGGPVPLLVKIEPGAGDLAGELVTRLEAVNFAVTRADTVAADVTFRRTLTLPAGFSDSVRAANPVMLTLDRTQRGLDTEVDELRIRRASWGLLADVVALEENATPITPERLAAFRAEPPVVAVDVTRAGRIVEVPVGFRQAVPGTMVMFTLLVMLTSGAVLLVVERRQGLLRRLASAPVSRSGVVAAKWGARMIVGAIQIGFAMIVGTLLFRMDWGPHLGALLVVLAAYAGFCGALALVVGSLARSEGQAVAGGVITANVLAALGGCWWPIEVTPKWMQDLSLFLPTGLTMDALHSLVHFGSPPLTVLPHVAVLAGGALVLGLVAGRVFRFQ